MLARVIDGLRNLPVCLIEKQREQITEKNSLQFHVIKALAQRSMVLSIHQSARSQLKWNLIPCSSFFHIQLKCIEILYAEKYSEGLRNTVIEHKTEIFLILLNNYADNGAPMIFELKF